MKYVIIGNCIAAAGAVEGIRSVDRAGEILIVDGEKRGCYTRPLISYYLAGSKTLSQMYYRSAEFFAENRVQIISGRAAKINAARQTVMLDEGTVLDYDHLLLATGASPTVPELPGIEQSWVKTFYTWDDACEIDAIVAGGGRAVVLGSGLIGVKAAEALQQRGMKVVLIEKQNHLLPRLLSARSAAAVTAHVETAGLKVITGHELVAIGDQEVALDDGSLIAANLLIIAVGTRPNQTLAREAGLQTNRGIIVDRYMRTSDPHIWAAGDVIESRNIQRSGDEVMALLPLAHREGFLSGCNMAGGAAPYSGGIFLNAVHIMGMHIIAAGDPEMTGLTLLWQREQGYLELTLQGEKLLRYIAINIPGITGPLTAIIERQIKVPESDWHDFMENPAISNLPGAYWAEMRRWHDDGSLQCG